MEGVIEEGAEALKEEGEENVLDLGIIGAGSRVEHYEIAGYTTTSPSNSAILRLSRC